MPASVKVTIKASQLRKNDVIVVTNQSVDTGSRLTVVYVEVKTKWVHVTYDDASRARISVDDDVIVVRPQTTMTELTDATNAHAARWARRCIEEAGAEVEKAKQKLIENLGYRADFHDNYYQSYIEAQTYATIWKLVAAYARCDDEGLVGALYEVRDEIINDEFVGARFESGSTSAMTNVVKSIEREAKSIWLQRLKYKLPQRGRVRSY